MGHVLPSGEGHASVRFGRFAMLGYHLIHALFTREVGRLSDTSTIVWRHRFSVFRSRFSFAPL
jgi:hypothetical protein